MWLTAIIAFREFLEAFLIIGVFLGISKKLHLKKETEIIAATLAGILISLLLSTAMYLFGDRARNILTEKNADMLESYLLIFSGFFIAYVIFSLHKVMRRERGNALIKAHKKMQQNVFDLSLFLTIIFLVLREGFEIALFTASTSLFSAFRQNFTGLIAGFFIASIVGAITFVAYIRFPIGKVFKLTEYMIILLGASLVQNGITKILVINMGFNLSKVISFNFLFLPDEDTFFGHILQGLTGIDRNFSLARFIIMVIYITVIYKLFIRQNKKAVK